MRTTAILSILLAGLCATLQAQIERLDNTGSFSAEKVFLGAGGHHSLPESRDASRILGLWGVTFSGGSKARPAIAFFMPSGAINITPFHVSVVENRPLEGSSAGVPLIVDFQFPVRRCVFDLTNGPGSVTLTAFDSAGNKLGEVADVELPSIGMVLQLGMETSSPEGISKISIDYGANDNAEQVVALTIDYLDRPVFETYLAHAADLHLPDGRSIHTTVSILNRSNTTATGEVVFLDRLADDSSPPAGDTVRVPFEVKRFRAAKFDTDSLGITPFTGFVRVVSFAPVTATASYRVLAADGLIQAQAGIAGDVGKSFWVAPAEKTGFLGNVGPVPFEDEVETALAVANLSGEDNQIFVTLIDENRETSESASMTLLPRGQEARFLSQLFALEGRRVEGTLWIFGFHPVAVTVLQTRQGLPLSSLPAGSSTP